MNKTQENKLKELIVLQALCNKDLLFFTRYFYKFRFGRRFIVNPHHRIVCHALNRVMSGQCRKLIINIYPRASKTELAVINNIACGIGRNPEAKFIHLSYSDDLVLENSEAIRDILSLEEYKSIFGDLQIKKDSRAKKNWKTTKKGGLYAAATGGQVTGFGAGLVDNFDVLSSFWEEFSDIMADEFMDETTGEISTYGGALIIDDPIKPEDAESDILREGINKRFDSTIKNRVNSRNTPIVVMGQRTHPFDLCGHLMRNEDHGWDLVSIPAILTPEDMDKEYNYVNDESESCRATLRQIYREEYEIKIREIERNISKNSKHGSIYKQSKKIIDVIKGKINDLYKIVDEDGKTKEFALWEFKHRLEELHQMMADDPTTFNRQYMQDPKPAFGLMYPKKWKTYREIDFRPEIIRSYTDVADEGSDYLFSVAYAEFMGLKYVLDIVYTQAPTEKTEKMVAEMHNRYQVNYAIMESNNGGKPFCRNVERICREMDNFRTTFDWFYQTDNKDARIRENSSTVQNIIVFPEDWASRWREFHKHITNYMLIGKNKYKDCADGLTGIVEKMPYGDRYIEIR